MNPAISSGVSQNSEAADTPIPNLQQIIDQIVDKVYTLKTQGTTETVMTLRFPPILSGATLTVSAFDSARGEFNITFSDLSPAAKELLDMQQAQNSLQRALQDKGYTVHIVITTTETENRISFDESQPQQNERDQEDQQGQQQQQQQEEQ